VYVTYAGACGWGISVCLCVFDTCAGAEKVLAEREGGIERQRERERGRTKNRERE